MNQQQSFQRWLKACKTSAYEMAVEDILSDLENGWQEDALLKLDGGGCGPVAGGYAYQRKHGRYIVTQFRGEWRTQSFKVRDLITEAKRRMRNTPVQANLFDALESEAQP